MGFLIRFLEPQKTLHIVTNDGESWILSCRLHRASTSTLLWRLWHGVYFKNGLQSYSEATICYLPHPKDGGGTVFSLFVSSPPERRGNLTRSQIGEPSHPVLMEGTPIHPDRGYPSQVGLPLSGLDGVPPIRTGWSTPSLGLNGDTPPSGLNGVPPPPIRTGSGNPPGKQSSVASTCYASAVVSHAFTQQNSFVSIWFQRDQFPEHHRSVDSVLTLAPSVNGHLGKTLLTLIDSGDSNYSWVVMLMIVLFAACSSYSIFKNI